MRPQVATPTAVATPSETTASIFRKLIYPVALLALLSIWLFALRAPLWLDETLAYWQISDGFWKIWGRSEQMPSSIGYLYTLWVAKSVLGGHEIALKIPSTLAMLGAVYFLFRIAREFVDQENAFLICVLFCVEPDVAHAATDALPYAFALLTTHLAIFAFIRWMMGQQMNQAILFGIASAGILYFSFDYLFGAILPAFAIYYLVVRRRSIVADRRQLAAVLTSFTLLALPVVFRVVDLYRTSATPAVQAWPAAGITLNTLVSLPVLIGFVLTAFVAPWFGNSNCLDPIVSRQSCSGLSWPWCRPASSSPSTPLRGMWSPRATSLSQRPAAH
jgi:Dolichyl-phosphate-mannose-protein mannosyltransferase